MRSISFPHTTDSRRADLRRTFRGSGFVPFGRETLDQQSRKLFVVLDHQKSHADAIRSLAHRAHLVNM